MNGACGRLRCSFFSTVLTTAPPAASSAAMASASSLVLGAAFSPSHFQMRASNGGGLGPSQVTSTDQYSSGMKARIASSRSTTSRTATDCTRPADRPRCTLFHRIGLIS